MSIVLTALPLLALGYLFASLSRLAPRKPGYSHWRHTISELGETGAVDQKRVAWGLFMPIGVVFLLEALMLRGSVPAGSVVCLCIAVGYLVAAAFPCDAGSPVSGSARQAVHNLGGAVEYIGGAFALLAGAEIFGVQVRIAGFVVLAVAVALTIMPPATPRGLVQRIGEIVLFGSVAWMVERAWAGL